METHQLKFNRDNIPPLVLGSLTELEQQIGCVLPDDYRSFLIQHNGGEPERQILYVSGCNSDILIHYFLGIGRPRGDIQKWLAELDDDLNDTFLPIAFDPGGNALLMDKSSGKIYYWDSARHSPYSSDKNNAFEVANSFSDLLKKLKSDFLDSPL